MPANNTRACRERVESVDSINRSCDEWFDGANGRSENPTHNSGRGAVCPVCSPYTQDGELDWPGSLVCHFQSECTRSV